MYVYLFFLFAAVAAIPTWGLSLVVFWLLKRAYDKRLANALLAKAVTSMQQGIGEELFRVNNASISRVFDLFEVDGKGDGFSAGGVWLRWGVLRHPMINAGREFSIRTISQPGGHVIIDAAPGVDKRILSEEVDGVGNFRMAALAALAQERMKK